MKREYKSEIINVKRIIKQEKVVGVECLYENWEKKRHPFQCNPCRIENDGYIIVDFGREICGCVHILFGWNDKCGSVHIRLGESVAETYAEIGEKNAGNHHSLRDAYYPVVSCGEVLTSESGFRFVRIDAPKDDAVHISTIFAEENDNCLTLRGSFTCSDERINEIYKVAERTISLCVRSDNFWDGIKRDRVFWMGDFYPELLGAYMIYGQIPQFRNALDMVKDFNGSWINSIPSYSAWWLICLEKYYELSADDAYVKEMVPYIEKTIKDFSVIVGEKGDVSYDKSELSYYIGNEFFIDWPTYSTEDSEIGWRYLLIYALKQTKSLLMRFGLSTAHADELLKRLDRQEYKASRFKQVTALGVLADKIGEKEARSLLEQDGAAGMTTFMSFAIIEALRKIGDGEFAIQIIKEYFGAMLDLGATSFWEDFDLEWLKEDPLPLYAMPEKDRKSIHADFGRFCYTGLRHSLCHGWSSGFIDFFYRHILGITALEPGYKRIKIEPHLCGMDYAEGEIPSLHGKIYIRHEVVNGKAESIVRLPKGVTWEK